MELEILKKKISSFRGEGGRIRKVIPFAKIKAGPFALSNRYSPSWKIKNLIFMNA